MRPERATRSARARPAGGRDTPLFTGMSTPDNRHAQHLPHGACPPPPPAPNLRRKARSVRKTSVVRDAVGGIRTNHPQEPS
ncbi:hypothetical protein GCM10010252_58540 [Streptomyces aureoverticillatus]|nr:hypothetical protein GCM10010252_58540 [Streptomyces aureoverticillatus]